MPVTPHFICVPAAVVIFIALVLSIMTSLSLPVIDALPIVQTTFNNGSLVISKTNATYNASNLQNVEEIKFGIWTSCYYYDGDRTCLPSKSSGNNIVVFDSNQNSMSFKSSFNRGLAFEPVGTAFVFITFVCSASIQEIRVALGFWISLLTTILILITLGLNIATVVIVGSRMRSILGFQSFTPGIGFWLNIATFVLMILCTLLLFKLDRKVAELRQSGGSGQTQKSSYRN